MQTWQCPKIPPITGIFVCHDCVVCQPIFGGPNGPTGNYGHLHVNRTLESCLPVACPRRLPKTTEPESLTSCCKKKTVGDSEYNLVNSNGLTKGLNCLNSCVYEKVGSPGSTYCFAKGNQAVSCMDVPDQ